MYKDQVQICRSNLLTLSKLLEKVKCATYLTEILSWLGPALTQADLLSESISAPLWLATEKADLRVIRRLVNQSICNFNAFFHPHQMARVQVLA